nr:hypothetical protein [Tanacetum cinerariifolium]
MTGNKSYLVEYQDFNGGPVAFGGSKGQITGKGKIKTVKLDFEDVYFMKELRHFNLFCGSHMCDKKNKVLFIDTECLVLSPDFKLPDENQVLLRVLRQNNMHSFNLENIVPSGFIDPKFPKKVYKVVKALYGLHQAPRAWYANLITFLVKSRYRRRIIDKTLFIKKDKKDIMLTASTLIETKKPLVKDAEATDVDVHLYRSMIGSLMYLTACRPDIMYAVCACSRFQVTPKSSHLHAVKRIFRKSTTGGCQFFGRRLISWQCKKQTIVTTSTIEAEYVAAVNCCRQVLWIQNQMLDYGFNFMNTKFYIDNESTICIVKNPVFHSKTKHIEIRHHFIKDAYEKKLIQTEGNLSFMGLWTFYHAFIHLGNFNKLDDLVGEGDDYSVNEGRSTDKIKVLIAKAKGVSSIGETLSTTTLAVSTARSRMKRMSKRQKTDADLKEKEQLRVFLNIIPDEEREVDYAVLDKRYP